MGQTSDVDQSDSALCHWSFVCFRTTTLTHTRTWSHTYVRMLFLDYSSAFNTIVPSNTIVKSYRGLLYGPSQIRSPGLTGKSMPNLKHGPTPTTQVIWRSTGSPGTCSGELLAVLRGYIGTKWSLTTRAPMPETCGLNLKPSQTIKGKPAVLR